jgi:hypothetical protein
LCAAISAGALLFTLLCLIGGAAYGWQESHSVEGVIEVLWIVGVLAVLEISLSFDNAVVNASVLGRWTRYGASAS